MRRIVISATAILLASISAAAASQNEPAPAKVDRKLIEPPVRGQAKPAPAVEAQLTSMEREAAKLEAAIDKIKADLDAIDDLNEMEALRLQMMMDRLSKIQSTLSNVLKKVSETQNSIAQNIK